jgi:lamin tail-like protein
MSSLIGGSMKRIHLLVLLSLLALPLAAAPASGSGAGSIVVGELYASGGNSGAAYANDYVELFNRGTGTVAIDGWTLQYASAAGTTWQQTALTGSIPAGGSYLVQLASGGVTGAALPAADATGTSNLAATGGKVAIVDDATALSCGEAAGSCAGSASIEDLVGYGAAADYEGTSAAPAPSATLAISRAGGGCTDTDDSAADFATAAPNPLNSSAAPATCSGSGGGGGGPGDADVSVDVQPELSIALDHATLSFPAAVPGTTPAPLPEHVTVTSNDPNGYTLTVHRTAFAPHDLPLGIGIGTASLAAVPIAPAPDLLLATTSTASAAAGDVWNTSVGFVSPLPVVPAGHYTATLTFTAIGR